MANVLKLALIFCTVMLIAHQVFSSQDENVNELVGDSKWANKDAEEVEKRSYDDDAKIIVNRRDAPEKEDNDDLD